MGIDIYAKWRNQSEEEKEKQYTGFSVVSGDVGYLREAYHGEPYATHIFVKEAFESEEAKISAKTLKERLPETLAAVVEREQLVYHEKNWYEIFLVMKSYVDFAELCEKQEKKTNEPCTIIASY
jgi:hypothetical protein